MRLKLFSMLAASLLVAACSEESRTTSSTGGGAAVTTPPASSAPPAVQAGPVRGSQEDFVVNVGDRVFFAYDKYDLSADARRTLERQAAWLRQYPNNRLVIEGHADERGTREYNLALGERRANASRDYLIALGIASNRLSTISYGKERPAVLGSNEAAWGQNRRAVGVVQR